MKSILAAGGIPTFISLHESEVYENLINKICKDELNERDAYIMQGLVNKGLVKRVIENKKVYFMRRSGN